MGKSPKKSGAGKRHDKTIILENPRSRVWKLEQKEVQGEKLGSEGRDEERETQTCKELVGRVLGLVIQFTGDVSQREEYSLTPRFLASATG